MPDHTPKNVIAVVTAAILAVALSFAPPLSAADNKPDTSLEGFRIIKVAPFIIPGNAFTELYAITSVRLGHWLRTRREKRRQRLQMRQLRALDNRMLKDIGVACSEIPYIVTQKLEES